MLGVLTGREVTTLLPRHNSQAAETRLLGQLLQSLREDRLHLDLHFLKLVRVPPPLLLHTASLLKCHTHLQFRQMVHHGQKVRRILLELRGREFNRLSAFACWGERGGSKCRSMHFFFVAHLLSAREDAAHEVLDLGFKSVE